MIPKVDVAKQVKNLVPAALTGGTTSSPRPVESGSHAPGYDTATVNKPERSGASDAKSSSATPLETQPPARPAPDSDSEPSDDQVQPPTRDDEPLATPHPLESEPPSSEAEQTLPPSASSSSAPPPPNQPPPLLKQKTIKRNMVLPLYEPPIFPDNTIRPQPVSKSILQTALRFVNKTLFNERRSAAARPASVLERLTKSPQSVKRIAVIGVHGWFPNRILQRVVGEPTGTSVRFAAKMGAAVRQFFQSRYNINLPSDAITLMPLEGEGKVEQRVEILYQNLVNSDNDWTKKLREADLVFVVTHSQGTPVSTILLARLIEEGLLDVTRQKIGVLAMAGISHGPFPSLKSSLILKYVEADPARELFDFNDAESAISQRYQAAMRRVLAAGVRMTAIGSWYDQVVPLYSAVMHGYNHPNIYRALYIDGADYVPDFLSHLVVYALKLRNAGMADHDLVVHLSEPLTGSVYGFGTQGHSVIYEELATYMLSIGWTMGRNPIWTLAPDSESQEATGVLEVRKFDAPTRLNPYHLPFIMSELIHSGQIRGEPSLSAELRNLVDMYKMWDPKPKDLKDLRYRLDFLKSRL
ncbi:hypothetical protein HK097_003897 [Rhizophlyctis rosea]|uniref:YMC020W-like alpha/beta hydrolase domain-containing protein n=1 Tax=Rhizophlyctis rosea TaxID=64517 RepID=A0AAD5WZB5_9FUNG|nr:hypothetical protein HK097_003897 [Rhizophlyctis rosea]